MATALHEPSEAAPETRRRSGMRDMWAALAIAVIWLAVLFSVLLGPDVVSTSVGVSSTTLPSGLVVALFATPATWAVAKYGFGGRGRG